MPNHAFYTHDMINIYRLYKTIKNVGINHDFVSTRQIIAITDMFAQFHFWNQQLESNAVWKFGKLYHPFNGAVSS